MKNFLRRSTGFSPKSLKKGFSLAEVMVSVAILGVVIMATVSQLQLSSKSATDMAADAEINNVTNKIISAIGATSVCVHNFQGELQDAVYTSIVDINGAPLIQENSTIGTSGGELKVSRIETKKTSDNEMVLILSFQKKKFGLGSFFLTGPKREIPINTILQGASGSPIDYCFANYDLVIKTSIQQSCKGNSSFYNPDSNPPYGACEHVVKPLACTTAGQFLKSVTTVNGAVEFTCGKLTEDCPEGQAVQGFDSNGQVKCEYIFKTCAAGEVIMKVGGQHVCRKLDCGPSTQLNLSAFRGFDASGNLLCTPITTAATCPNGQYATQISSTGTVTCSTSPFQGGTCPVGKYINGINSDGTVKCDTYIQVPFDCPANQAITSIKPDGTPDCEPINSTLKCGGTSRTYNACREAGGVVITGASSHCKFNGPSCPSGWTRCVSYGSQYQVSCSDTSNTFYCDEWKQIRYAYPTAGNNIYSNNTRTSNQCHHWVGSAGTQGQCLDTIVAAPIYTEQRTVGCY